jgi:hypothetical protein
VGELEDMRSLEKKVNQIKQNKKVTFKFEFSCGNYTRKQRSKISSQPK